MVNFKHENTEVRKHGTKKFDKLVKSRKVLFSVIPAKVRQSALADKFNAFWMPDQVRHDDFETFYKTIKFRAFVIVFLFLCVSVLSVV
jgi:hypothetical protein